MSARAVRNPTASLPAGPRVRTSQVRKNAIPSTRMKIPNLLSQSVPNQTSKSRIDLARFLMPSSQSPPDLEPIWENRKEGGVDATERGNISAIALVARTGEVTVSSAWVVTAAITGGATGEIFCS